jgi:hypothetical protein
LESSGIGSREKTEITKYRRRYRSKKAEFKPEEDHLEPAELKIKHHHYDAKTIQQSLKLLIGCSISLSGIKKVFELLNQDKSQATPSCTVIRKWLGRVGVYELTREKEQRNDWIFIVDFTIELGQQKALVVLGVSQEHFLEKVVSEQ